MEWIIGVYIAIGVFKAVGKLGADPTERPIWMSTQKNPVIWALQFLIYALMWPLARG